MFYLLFPCRWLTFARVQNRLKAEENEGNVTMHNSICGSAVNRLGGMTASVGGGKARHTIKRTAWNGY